MSHFDNNSFHNSNSHRFRVDNNQLRKDSNPFASDLNPFGDHSSLPKGENNSFSTDINPFDNSNNIDNSHLNDQVNYHLNNNNRNNSNHNNINRNNHRPIPQTDISYYNFVHNMNNSYSKKSDSDNDQSTLPVSNNIDLTNQSIISFESLNDTILLPSGEYLLNKNKPKTFLNSHDIEKITDSEVFPQKRLFSFLHSKKIKEVPKDDSERVDYPMLHVNPLSYIFVWWVLPLIKLGYKRTIQPNDLFKMDKKLTVEHFHDNFQRHLDYYFTKARKQYMLDHPDATIDEIDEKVRLPKYSVHKSLFFTFKKQFLMACVFAFLANCASGLNPLVTKRLIEFVQKKAMMPDTKINAGIGYAIGASAMMFINGIFFNHFFLGSQTVGVEVKSVLTKAALTKMLKASNYAKHKFPNGKVTSFITTDAARIEFGISFQPFLVGFPAVLTISLVLLITNVGAIALVGIGIFMLVLMATGAVFKVILDLRKNAIVFTDNRVSLMREILNSMKMVKFYAWEDAYEKNVVDLRNKEVNNVRKMQYTRNFVIALAMSVTNIASLATFLCMYEVNNNGRNPANLFASLSSFQVLALQMFFFPMALGTGADMVAGLGRLQNLLELPNEKPIDVTPSKDLDVSVAMRMTQAGFEWEDFQAVDDAEEKERELEDSKKDDKKSLLGKKKKKDKKKDKLEEEKTKKDKSDKDKPFTHFADLDFQIKKGEFIVITGPIGCGKTSLLNAMAGFMKMTGGKLEVDGELLLCGYPWILNATVRDNITFGSPYDQARYDKVVRVCSLQADLDILPAGDRTEIGERGITLSGGQKARINLARAVYKTKDIFLFDDILSAVDARVGRHIMDECILGLLNHKTRILATHQLSLIDKADRIIVLDADGTFDIGTLKELKNRNETLINLLEFSHSSHNEEEEEENDLEELESEMKEDQELELVEKQLTSKSLPNGQIIEKEERAVNSIKISVYHEYIKAAVGNWGYLIVSVYIFFVATTAFLNLFSSVWLSYWTENKWPNRSTSFYMGMYSFFVFCTYIFMNVQFTVLCVMGLSASKHLNLNAVSRILHTPMGFLDTTPLGRILNRFTKDTDSLDNEITENIRLMVAQIGNIVGVITMCIIYLPWFAIAVPFLVLVFILIANHYQATGREIKRLEAVQRSFVYNNFNEVLGGMDTIKAYSQADRFLTKADFLINKTNEAGYLVVAVQRWVAILLDCVAVCFALIITLLCVTRVFHISPSAVGVLLTYVLQLPGLLNTVLRASTQVENDMNSAERLVTYATELPTEAAYRRSDVSPPENWPNRGELVFEDVDFAYREGLPIVLKNINITVRGGEKIGICGRTGAGKSTIMNALYRLNELSNGRIIIDGVDVSKLGLYDLRRNLTIIPQDPVLFRGSIRKNLDPFDEYSEDLLWNALVKSGAIEEDDLEDVKREEPDDNNSQANMHKFHLEQTVEDEGSNFSLGERQVLALTRALVRQAKVLILDEATSSVDYKTDGKIQSRIVKEFGDCTILCIAHRLKTILNYDRILVLEKGVVAEFDTPWNLFQTEKSIFRSMCGKAGIKEADFIRR